MVGDRYAVDSVDPPAAVLHERAVVPPRPALGVERPTITVNHGRTTATTIGVPGERLRATELGRSSRAPIASSGPPPVGGPPLVCPFITRHPPASQPRRSSHSAAVPPPANPYLPPKPRRHALRPRHQGISGLVTLVLDAVPQRPACVTRERQKGGSCCNDTLSGAAPAGQGAGL